MLLDLSHDFNTMLDCLRGYADDPYGTFTWGIFSYLDGLDPLAFPEVCLHCMLLQTFWRS